MQHCKTYSKGSTHKSNKALWLCDVPQHSERRLDSRYIWGTFRMQTLQTLVIAQKLKTMQNPLHLIIWPIDWNYDKAEDQCLSDNQLSVISVLNIGCRPSRAELNSHPSKCNLSAFFKVKHLTTLSIHFSLTSQLSQIHSPSSRMIVRKTFMQMCYCVNSPKYCKR